MKTIKILLISILTVAIISCEKEEPVLLEPVDLKFNQAPLTKKTPKHFFISKCNTKLNFDLKTKEDQMGKFAATEMVEFRGKIWSVGGYLNNRSYPYQTNGVWSSSDGSSWQSEVFNAFDSRSNHTLTVFDNKLWVIGGVNGAGHQLSDVWNSADGRNWSLVTNTPDFGSITGHNTLVFKNHLVVFKQNDIWASANGISWKMIANDIFPERAYGEFILFKDVLYIIGGEEGSGTYYNEIWKSSNGKNWSQVSPRGAVFSPRSRQTVTVYQDKVWTIGGTLTSGYDSDEIWASTNMEDWCKYGGSVPISRLSSHSSVKFNDAICIFGGFSSYGMTGNIWSMKAY